MMNDSGAPGCGAQRLQTLNARRFFSLRFPLIAFPFIWIATAPSQLLVSLVRNGETSSKLLHDRARPSSVFDRDLRDDDSFPTVAIEISPAVVQ